MIIFWPPASGIRLPVWVDTHAWSLALKRYLFTDIGLKNTHYFGKDEEFFAVKNVPFPDFKEWILEREWTDPFQINYGGPVGISFCYLIHTYIKCTLFEDFIGVGQHKYHNWWLHGGDQQTYPYLHESRSLVHVKFIPLFSPFGNKHGRPTLLQVPATSPMYII